MRIIVFGDSVAYGAWDTEGGWVERLKKVAHVKAIKVGAKTKLQVMNLGIGGDTSTKILARMKTEIEARYSPNWPFVFVFSFGANDERMYAGEVETSTEEFKDNVRKIISLAREYTDKIIFLEITPIGNEIVNFKDSEYSDSRLQQYSKHLESIVLAEHVSYVPIRKLFKQNDAVSLFADDMIHPNDVGHKIIADAVIDELQKFQIIK